MKKLVLSLLVLSLCTLGAMAQNKWIRANPRVSGTTMVFELYKKLPDNSYALLRTDSSQGIYLFDSLAAGVYRFHVSIAYTKYIPTWHPRKALWEEAADIDLTVADSFVAEDGLLPNPAFTGPASIHGEMTEGLMKRAGDPLKNIRVLILDNTGQLVKMVNTDDSGKFTAASLPVGTYTIKTDLINVSNTNPKTVSLDSAHLDATVRLTVNKNGTVNTGLVRVTEETSTSTAYPNPSNGALHIRTGAAGFAYRVFSLSGGLVKDEVVEGNEALVDLRALEQGIYMLQVMQGGKTETHRLVLSF